MYTKSKNVFNHLFSLLLILIILYLILILINIFYSKNKENYEDTSNPNALPQDSGKCKTDSDVVDMCINYESCCIKGSTEKKECICKHPFVQNCRNTFTNCINNNPNNLSNTDIMNKCIEENKTCCKPYNSIQILSNIYNKPINNEPVINKICTINPINNIDQKCMELCFTNPECKAYSVNKGAVVQNYGTCSLYSTADTLIDNKDKYVSATFYSKK